MKEAYQRLDDEKQFLANQLETSPIHAERQPSIGI